MSTPHLPIEERYHFFLRIYPVDGRVCSSPAKCTHLIWEHAATLFCSDHEPQSKLIALKVQVADLVHDHRVYRAVAKQSFSIIHSVIQEHLKKYRIVKYGRAQSASTRKISFWFQRIINIYIKCLALFGIMSGALYVHID